MKKTLALRELVEDTGSWENNHAQASIELDALLITIKRLKKELNGALKVLAPFVVVAPLLIYHEYEIYPTKYWKKRFGAVSAFMERINKERGK
jgi:hypothetical protein